MAALTVTSPFSTFTDTDGTPLENGYVYIGTTSLNAETNPIQVYWDAALSIPAAQPIRTIGGYASRSGSPGHLYVNEVNYSIIVRDGGGSLVFSSPNGTGIIPNANGIVYSPGGTGAVDTTVQDKLREYVSVFDFMTAAQIADVKAGTLLLDVTTALNTAFAKGGRIEMGTGAFRVQAGQIVINRSVEIIGNGIYQSKLVPMSGSGPVITIRKDAGTPAASVNKSGQLVAIRLQDFSIQDTRSGDYSGISCDAVDEIYAERVTCYGLKWGSWIFPGTASVRESEWYSCYDWFCGDATHPSWSIISMNTAIAPAYGCVDVHNGLYFFGCKSVYNYGCSLFVDTLDANPQRSLRHATWVSHHWEGQGYDINNNQTNTPGDNVWIRSGEQNINFISCQNNGFSGYVAGVSSGYAGYRLGDLANGKTVENVVISGGQVGRYYTWGPGGPNVVCENVKYVSFGNGLVLNGTPSNNRGVVLGGLPCNSNTVTPSAYLERISCDLSVIGADAYSITDPDGNQIVKWTGKIDSDKLRIPTFLYVGNTIYDYSNNPYQSQKVLTLASPTATPDVSGGIRQLRISPSSPVTITNFLNGYDGQDLTIIIWGGAGNTTIAHNSTIQLAGHTNWTPSGNATITFVKAGSNWWEKSRVSI